MKLKYWKYTISNEIVDAATKIATADTSLLACLDSEVRDMILLVCGTIANDDNALVS